MPELKVIHYQEASEFDKDIWDGRVLGADIRVGIARTLNFSFISQPWLKAAAKWFIRYSFATRSWRICEQRLLSIKHFSRYLASFHPSFTASDINRSMVIEYISYIAAKKWKLPTQTVSLQQLKMFFELSVINNWLNLTDQQLFYREDILCKTVKSQPRYIPQEVINQLNQNIDTLPESVMRMLLVIQESGMRVTELCELRFDCLRQDAAGDWWLNYYQFKMKKDHSICISRELAAVIQEQQKYINRNFGLNFQYLFCSRKRGSPKFIAESGLMSPQHFTRYLKRLGKEKNICDASGRPWNFTCHQFRHTVATRMINSGVPQHIIQRYLGHESPEMTNRYAQIFDQTLKEEFAKFKDKMVDVTGKLVSYESVASDLAYGVDPNSIDAQWLKKNIRAQALPTGLCGLPVNQPVCPHGANKCLTGPDGKGCPHFKTDIRYLDMHKEHLRRTNENIEWGHSNPDSRRSKEILDVNLPVKQSLERIIPTLESQRSTQQ